MIFFFFLLFCCAWSSSNSSAAALSVELCAFMSVLHLSVTETMAVDSMLPSPSSLSTPMLGLEGLPGRRRKKRTSIESNVRVVLERNFNTVRNSPNYQVYRALCLQVCTEMLSQKHKSPSNDAISFYLSKNKWVLPKQWDLRLSAAQHL